MPASGGAATASQANTKVADGLGAYAEKVETPDQIAPAIRNGLAANKKGQPAVLEIMTKEEETIPTFWR